MLAFRASDPGSNPGRSTTHFSFEEKTSPKRMLLSLFEQNELFKRLGKLLLLKIILGQA